MSRPILSYAFMASELPSLDWSPLEAAAQLSFTEGQRTQFLAALNAFLEQVSYHEASPSAKSGQRRLQQIHRYATGLATALADSSELGQAAAYEAVPPSIADLAALIRQLHQISLCAHGAQQSLRGRPGRPAHDALPRLIRACHPVYTDAGGTGRGCSWHELRGQFQGPFLDLLDGALHQAASPLGDTPLAQAIRIPRNTLAQAIKAAF